MKYNELKDKSVAELKQKSGDLRLELFQLKLKHKTAQLDQRSQLRNVRRDIARIETKISELTRGK